MLQRISQILKTKNLTSAKFADEIGVQRSSISHVLSGRNKPSLEFIQKILTTYPDINTDWLMFGKGDMSENTIKSNNEIDFPDDRPNIRSEDPIVYKKEKSLSNKPEMPLNKEISDITSETKNSNQKKIEKIVILFKDRSFKEYFPE